MELEEFSGFVTCSYNNQWWLACVLETHTKEVQISLTLLHPPGPSRSYKYPDIPVIVTLPSRTGPVYTLTQRLKLQRTNWKLEHIEFLSLLYVSFCQCVLYYVCVNVLQYCLTTSIPPDPIVVPKQLVPHKAR